MLFLVSQIKLFMYFFTYVNYISTYLRHMYNNKAISETHSAINTS